VHVVLVQVVDGRWFAPRPRVGYPLTAVPPARPARTAPRPTSTLE